MGVKAAAVKYKYTEIQIINNRVAKYPGWNVSAAMLVSFSLNKLMR